MSSADERIINRLQKIYDAQGAGGASFEELTGEPTDNAALGTALSGKVPTTRTVAGKALSSDVTLVKADVGLGNVDNTTDAAKPVSTAQQTALDLKVPTSRTVNGQALSGNVVVTGLMLDTAGAPDNGVGANGDYAFDDATKTIYGPKAAGVWPAGVVLGGDTAVPIYKATLTQSGTNAPVATVHRNTLGGTVVWGFTSTGIFTATLAGAFPADKTCILMSPPKPNALAANSNIIEYVRTSTDVITVRTTTQNANSGTSGVVNDVLTETLFEVQIEP